MVVSLDELKQLTRRLDINCVLDVGAHEGGYARLLRKEVRFAGEIVSFEPAAASFAALRAARAGDRHWRGHNYALGRTPGEATLNVYAESELNTLLAPSRYGLDRFPTMASPLPPQPVRVLALQLEVPVKHVYDGMPPLPQTLDRLAELGFEPTGMFPVTRDRDLLRVVEFDCVLRRGEVPAA